MDANFYRILEYLSDVPIGTSKDISHILNEIFPLDKYPELTGAHTRFTDALAWYTSHEPINVLRWERQFGYINVNLALTATGYQELNSQKASIETSKVNQSALSVNDSIIATNKAIQDSNSALLRHAVTQDGLIERQLELVRRQNRLYKYTLGLTAINIILGIAIYKATTDSNADQLSISNLQSQLASKDKELKQLQLLKSDTVHYVLHYPLLKNSPKKP